MAEAPELPTKVTYHYLKSNGFRVVHADGIFGGPTPPGYLQISFFNERFPIPQTTEYSVTQVGNSGDLKVGAETGRTAKDGLIREVEVAVTMSLDVAKALRGWLDTHIAALERVAGKAGT